MTDPCFSFWRHVAAPRWVCCSNKYRPSLQRKERGGKEAWGETARGTTQCEWSSHPRGNECASSLTTNTSSPLAPKQKCRMQTTGKEEPRMAKQTNQATHGAHTLSRSHSRDRKHTRLNSVSTKTRQACNRNQTNSNDFPALLPYKGIGTPSKKFSWWLQLSLFLPGPDSM